MRNPLTQVTGPEFLVLFAILITTVAVTCWLRGRFRDRSRELPPLDPPARIDPYEIAYLRAGGNELARVLIVGLIDRKYLRITKPESKWWKTYRVSSRIEHAPGHPEIAGLVSIERAVFEWFDSPRTPEEVFGRLQSTRSVTSLPLALTAHTVRYEQKLRSERLLTSDEFRDEARRNITLGAGLIAVIGLARFFIGISRDRPVGFLVLMAIAGVFIVVKAGVPGRLSVRGRAYLERTRSHWGWLKDSRSGEDWSPTLAAGVFGFAVLAGTEMSPVTDIFRRSNAGRFGGDGGGSGGGACGGGCGGSGGGGGGGGCGGGCGGCGGGG